MGNGVIGGVRGGCQRGYPPPNKCWEFLTNLCRFTRQRIIFKSSRYLATHRIFAFASMTRWGVNMNHDVGAQHWKSSHPTVQCLYGAQLELFDLKRGFKSCDTVTLRSTYCSPGALPLNVMSQIHFSPEGQTFFKFLNFTYLSPELSIRPESSRSY